MGLRYEQKVHDVLSAVYGARYEYSKGILFEDRNGLRRAIPDGILDLGDVAVVVEIKYSHCELAWWQLTRLYAPLLIPLLKKPLRLCEICHSFDPDIMWPTPPELGATLHRLTPGRVGVITWDL